MSARAASAATAVAIAPSEVEVVMMARALVRPTADLAHRLAARRDVPTAISPACAALVADALAHAWPLLWRRDRARSSASIADGRVVRGRIWERHAPAPLRFTPATLQLLRWLAGQSVGSDRAAALDAQPLAIGDEVAIYLALDAAAGSPAQPAIARQPMVRASALAHLGFAHLMAGPVPEFAPLVAGAGAIVVEALARELAERWAAAEHAKAALADPIALAAIGHAQSAALDGFLAACDAAGRRDLAGFALDAARPLMARWPAPVRLDPHAPLAARAAARQASGTLLRAIARWAAWDREHRGVRFIDDGYAIAQLLLARFEPIGHAGARAAERALAELASLSPTPAPNSSTIEDT